MFLALSLLFLAPHHSKHRHPIKHHRHVNVVRVVRKPAPKPIAKPAKPPVPAPPPFDPTLPITIKPPVTRFESVSPLPGVPGVIVDRLMSGGGIANQIAKNRDLQARIMWIDGTANIDKVNTEEKIIALVQKIKAAGFNTIVFDVKPISGQTLYPSRLAPKLLTWRGSDLPVDFDPLKIMCREARAAGLVLNVSLNAFSEGHQLFHVGPGYDKVAQQTVLYEPRVILSSPLGSTFPCSADANVMPADASQIGIFTSASQLPPPDPTSFAVSLAPRNLVVDGFEGGGTGKGVPTIPKGGAILVGKGLAGDFLRRNATPGTKLSYSVAPSLVPIGERPKRQYPLMMNPNDPQVQQYELDIVREVATNYDIDGIIYDDRLRYAGMDADFSPASEAAFESYIGHPVSWPGSIYQYSVSTNLTRGILPGEYWDAWIAFRALTIRNYLAKVKGLLKMIKPSVQLGDYAGSWFGEYPSLGSNWGDTHFDAGFWYQTNLYRQTGFAPLLDFQITGCYYPIATVHQAFAQAGQLGATVESAGALTNRAVRDSTWCIAGIALSDFKNDPDGLVDALSAACATTQGVMVFDLSHDIEPMWPVFARAFGVPRKSPQKDPVALKLVRLQRAALDKLNKPVAPVIILAGTSGTGQ